ncbi:DNA-dependent ATPase fun30 [Parahypoxylon ruwenzoriense]
MDRTTQHGGRAQGSKAAYIEIDDDDLDELANDDIPCSSPYFTQPTQIVNRTTQPTQIVNRTTLKAPSSPLVPSTPSTTIEVPASSPFQPKSQAKPSTASAAPAGLDKKPAVTSRIGVGSLMAPAGTSFRPPAMQQSSRKASGSATKKDYLDISDDDLLEDYKKHDSSDDDNTPMRGDIRPSSFMKKTPLKASKPGSLWPLQTDISLTDIRDLRLRHLTGQVYKIVQKVKPGITVQACRDALQKEVGWQVSRAVDFLTGRPNKSPSLPKAANTADNGMALGADAALSSDSETVRQPRRRLVRGTTGRRTRTHPSATIDLDSESDSNSIELAGSRKRRAPDPDANILTQSNLTTPPKKKARAEIATNTMSRKRKSGEDSEVLKDPGTISPRNKKAKIELDSKASSHKNEAEEKAKPIEISSDSDGDNYAEYVSLESSGEELADEQNSVLEYLNTCTVEELGRMTGMLADARLMVASRPFKRIRDAEKIARKDKSKSKSRRGALVGGVIVEKLSSWFQACEAATAVINECDRRGAELQSDIARWPVDRNGKPKTGSELNSRTLARLPISKKPCLLGESVQLKSYQLVGLNWMSLLHSKGYSGILADDMGLGKTCQVISFIAHLIESEPESDTGAHWPNLVIVPPSTYENWLSEFEKFAPDINVLAYYGPNRQAIHQKDAQRHHVVLTTYSQVEKREDDLRWLRDLNPYAAIFDEGHKLKNRNTLIYQQMMQVPTKWRLILSGTPIQNNLKELLTLLHFIEPSLFEEEYFEQLNTIFDTKVASKDVHNFAALAEGRVDRARAVMAPFILQRRKDDVLDLAKKVERLEVVGMHPLQKAIYDGYKNRYLLPKGAKGSKFAKDAHPYMQLRKAAIHHQLFRHHFTDDKVRRMVDILWKNCSEEELGVQSKEDRHKALLLEDVMSKSDFQLHLWCKDFPRYIGHLDIPDRSWEESPKVQKLLELVRGYMQTGDRALIFSRFEMVIDILRETFHNANIPYCELTGATQTAQRFPECQRFTNHPEIPVFLLTTGAGGTGLNLTAANKIIIFDQSDNPQDDVQASNRAHRIGQTREVEVIRIITSNSIERFIYNSCVKKLMLAARVEREHGVEDEDEESVEEQCRKLMLLEDEDHADINADVEAAPTIQKD